MVPGVTDAGDVAVGGRHACALHQTGAVSCWGDSKDGQLGTFAHAPGAAHAVQVTWPMVAIGVGEHHSCGQYRDGRIACWGSNARGESGWGQESLSLSPERIVGLSEIDGLLAARSLTCAQRRGEALCWGAMYGLQPGSELLEPTRVEALRRSRGIVGAGGTACAWTADHTAHCLAGTASVPTTDVLQIVPGDRRSFPWALRSDGVWRQPSSEAKLLPEDFIAALAPPPGKPQAIVEIAAWSDADGLCARLQQGRVRCLPDVESDEEPLEMSLAGSRRSQPLPDARSIRSNRLGVCALLVNGTVACIDDWSEDPAAELVPQLREVVELAAGQRHFCARTHKGEVFCWGGNESGQLGDGTTRSRTKSPVKVIGLTGTRGIAAGDVHTCALTQAREVVCWGDHRGNGRAAHAKANERSASPVVIRGTPL
nr:hypothetical protein [Nannocystis pusilla]